jgi:hypothetical protein
METTSYQLIGVVPHSNTTGIDFIRLEMPKYESSSLAVVWYRLSKSSEERGARIDLQKQVFLDDFENFDRGSLNAEARLIVQFVHSRKARRTERASAF